jgi:hypothetical protein
VLSSGADAQPRPDVTSWLSVDTVRVGEPFEIIVTASTPEHRAVGFPPADAGSEVFGELEVLRRSRVHTRPVGVMYAIDSVAYTVQVAAPGSMRVPRLPVWVDAATDTVVTHTRPRTLWVRAAAAPGLAQEGAASPGVVWGLLGLLVAAVVSGGVYLWMDRQAGAQGEASPDPSPPPSDPYARAAERLEALAARSFSGPEEVEAGYEALSAVVCTYLARRLDVPAREQSTAELVATLRGREALPAAAVERLQGVLEEAELVKFAGRRPDPSAATGACREARAALEALEAALPDASAGTPER